MKGRAIRHADAAAADFVMDGNSKVTYAKISHQASMTIVLKQCELYPIPIMHIHTSDIIQYPMNDCELLQVT